MTLADLCELIYPEPDALDTLEQCERREHLDLAHLCRPELRRASARLELRLLLDDSPSLWLIERQERLRASLSKAAERR